MVPQADHNGILLSYTVTYKALPDGSPLTKVVSAPATQVTLTGLNEYTNYSITVFASTVKGGGLVSEPIFVVTDEDSKSLVLIRFICSWICGNGTALGSFRMTAFSCKFRESFSKLSLRLAVLLSVRQLHGDSP